MMIEEKQNILRSFEGQKIDQSVHVARWATINNEDTNRNIFMKYAAGSSSNTIQPISSEIIHNENMFNTQQSQVHQIDTGFKKLKNTQIEMLKQLKQQYQVLRTLNIEQKSLNQNKILNSNSSKSSSQLNGSQRQNNSQILSSSSHHGKKPQMNTRQAQILAIQKKQLQMVINNSMRKIQELLHSEMQYKKQIHQLKIQVNGRQNTDHQYEAMLKTLKKNQIYTHQTIQSLKKENQKYKFQNRQLNEKISTFQGQLIVKDQQIRRIFDEKRKTQDLVRIQKDRFFNVDLDYKKIKMEYELLQKQKNSQILRLTKQLQFKDSSKLRQLQGSIKRHQQDITTKDKIYSLILTQVEELKRKINDQQRQIAQLRSNHYEHVLDKEHIADILTNFRDQNDNVSFNRNMNEVLQKLQHIDHHHSQQLQDQLAALKHQILNIKQTTHQGQNANFILYEQKIQQLQNEKNYLADELRRLKKNHQEINNKYALLRKTTDEQSQQLRNLKSVKTTHQIDHSVLSQTGHHKRQIQILQQQLRVSKRKVDQSEFKASKAMTQLQYKIRLQHNQHQSVSTKYLQDLNRAKFDLNSLREQNQRFRNSYEKKLSQKQAELSSLRSSLHGMRQSGSPSQKLKQQLQLILKTERQQYRRSTQKLTLTITNLSKSNQKYILQSNKYIQYQNELNLLKEIMRSSIKLSEGIDHLWRIKETQYQNIDLILETTKAIPQKYY